ncbi:DinB family protein [uncultured Mucilaginibacter sp.]|uniref:DinB family protein n=1 Tax=uncultured Mucilaginibacter sp. TaxID=797541 RepID=UPI0025F51501|nr:DinB family protein [uncultured Mucilaginibacter sp.]
MNLNKALIGEMQHEAASTRKMLERVPNDKLGWKPHEKSMTLGKLATHVSDLPNWTGFTINADELDLASGAFKPFLATSTVELLKHHDESVAGAIAALESVTNEQLMEMWTLRMGDHVIFTMPKVQVLRNMVFSHMVHHRGQLSVYLRMLDVPVPGMYGPSADDAR